MKIGFLIIFSLDLLSRYQDKEGWAPASYLKKMKDDLSPRKKTVTGPVEIIGNIMEISNLLNKKALSEKDVQTEGVPESPQVARKEISLPIPCAADSSPVNATQEGKCKAEPASPAVARIAPHRVEIGWLSHLIHCSVSLRFGRVQLFSDLNCMYVFSLCSQRFPSSQAKTSSSKRCNPGKSVWYLWPSIHPSGHPIISSAFFDWGSWSLKGYIYRGY